VGGLPYPAGGLPCAAGGLPSPGSKAERGFPAEAYVGVFEGVVKWSQVVRPTGSDP
jgi:hypothetical protein